MGNDFNFYAKKLDEEIKKIPTAGEIRKAFEGTLEYLFDSSKIIVEVLQYIGATDVENKVWHEHMRTILFHPKSSEYYRVSRLAEIEGILIDENWRGVIGIGFDEDFDYRDDEQAEMIAYHINDYQTTDLRVFKAENWRDVLSEFFHKKLIE